jgi:hypothetical protein
MQVSQLPNIKEKLFSSTMPQYMSAIGQSETLEKLQEATKQMFRTVADHLFPDQKLIFKADAEPQSKMEEEVKDEKLGLKKAVLKELDAFLEAVRNFEIVQEADII